MKRVDIQFEVHGRSTLDADTNASIRQEAEVFTHADVERLWGGRPPPRETVTVNFGRAAVSLQEDWAATAHAASTEGCLDGLIQMHSLLLSVLSETVTLRPMAAVRSSSERPILDVINREERRRRLVSRLKWIVPVFTGALGAALAAILLGLLGG